MAEVVVEEVQLIAADQVIHLIQQMFRMEAHQLKVIVEVMVLLLLMVVAVVVLVLLVVTHRQALQEVAALVLLRQLVARL